jgi:GH24 family phage-related lysozyme (muramidase)
MAVIGKALKLILDAEGMNQPGAWPGGASGITIGIGYDLGYVTVDQFESDWGEFLTAAVRERLKAVVGLTGLKAKNRAAGCADIKVRRTDAEEVFRKRTIPRYELLTMQAFPGLADLPPEVQGALVSLVYNRGASMVDKPGEDRRREMRAIRDAVEEEDLQEIADQLRSMKRLWEGKGLDGLLARREAEARLVESAIV